MRYEARAAIYELLEEERAYQDTKWGNPDHDLKESAGNFLIYIERYLVKAKAAYVDAGHTEAAMHEVRKIATLAVTAMELFGAPPRQ